MKKKFTYFVAVRGNIQGKERWIGTLYDSTDEDPGRVWEELREVYVKSFDAGAFTITAFNRV